VEDFCGKAEIPDNADGDDWLSVPLKDVKVLVNQITYVRSKQMLHEIPMDTLMSLLHVIDRQIRCSQGLSIDVKENVSCVISLICSIKDSAYYTLMLG
jgi:cohesin loading factor subunit SCC2